MCPDTRNGVSGSLVWLMLGFFGLAVGMTSAAPLLPPTHAWMSLSLTNTDTASLTVPGADMLLQAPTGSSARMKLIAFEIEQIDLTASDGQTTYPFQLSDLPPLVMPRTEDYDAQAALPPQFWIALGLQVQQGIAYQIDHIAYRMTFATTLGLGGLEQIVDLPSEIVLSGATDVQIAPFTTLANDLYLSVGLSLEQLQADLRITQGSTRLERTFAQQVGNVSELIVSDLDRIEFAVSAELPVDAELTVTADGNVGLGLAHICLARADYPPPVFDVRPPQPAPALPNRARRLYQAEEIPPELLRVLSAWPADVQWFTQDGAIPGANGDTLLASLASALDEIYAEVVPQVGPQSGEQIDTAHIPIPNQPPSVTSATLQADPDPPITLSTLTTIPSGWSDPEGATEGYLYRWFNQQGLIEGAEAQTLGSDAFQRGDTLFALVIPFDGVVPGAAVASPPMTIQNALPAFAGVVLTLLPDPDAARETSTIIVSTSGWSDPDEDSPGYRYEWYNQDGVVRGSLAQLDESVTTVHGASTFEFSMPFKLKAGQLITIPMFGVQQGELLLTAPSGVVLGPFTLPEQAGSSATGEFEIELLEAGDYRVDETFQLVVKTDSLFVNIESTLQQRYTWTYPNSMPGTRVYSYTSRVSNLQVAADGKIAVDLDVPDPAEQVDVPFVIQEDIPAQSPISAEINYGADFDKRSGIAIANARITGPQITGDHFDKGDELYVLVTPNDGIADGASRESTHIQVINSLPRLGSAMLTVDPSPARVGSMLATQVTGLLDDDPGDTPGVRYQWFNGDQPIPGADGETLAGAFQKGDVISVQATPWDGSAEGTVLHSDTVTIENSTPTAPQVKISPVNPSDTQDLTWELLQASSDADGDPLTYHVRWFIGSVEQTDFADQETIPAATTKVGQRWRISVTASDGSSTSPAGRGDFVTIQQGNTPPLITGVGIIPIPAFVGDTLQAKAEGWSDVDGDTEQIQYLWEAQMADDWTELGTGPTLDTTGLDASVELRVAATPNDGESEGEAKIATVQLGGTLWNSNHTVGVTLSAADLRRHDARLALMEDTSGQAEAVQNSQGYYRPVGDFWRLSVQEPVLDLTEVVSAAPLRVSFCGTTETAEYLVEVSGSRLRDLATSPEGDCLTAEGSALSAWALAVSDVPDAPWDTNQDGIVDILDLVTTGASFGGTLERAADPNPDINRDWSVDILDLVAIGAHFGESTAPAAPVIGLSFAGTLSFSEPHLEGDTIRCNVIAELSAPIRGYHLQLTELPGVSMAYPKEAQGQYQLPGRKSTELVATRLGAGEWKVGDQILGEVRIPYQRARTLGFEHAIVILADGRQARLRAEPLELNQFFPDQTRLLRNYPNPFNPETWIPFQLHESAAVRVVIYDALGREIRAWNLGTLPPGYYRTRDRALHWDGRNQSDEPVASGTYFYHLHANDLHAMRRLTVLK